MKSNISWLTSNKLLFLFIIFMPVLITGCSSGGSDSNKLPATSDGVVDQLGGNEPVDGDDDDTNSISAPPKTLQHYGGDSAKLNTVFEQHLASIGQLSVAEFATRYTPTVPYQTEISWDVTSAEYWEEMHQYQDESVSLPKYDFSLNDDELAIMKKNGFVVSERMGTHSFAELYYRIFWNDLPVFISADSVLHAWHRSFDYMLEELESNYFSTSLQQILSAMRNQLPQLLERAQFETMQKTVKQLDIYLTVASSLLNGNTQDSALDQNTEVAKILALVAQENLATLEIFGERRDVDFSQMIARGHYTHSEELKRYFRTIMWLGRIEFNLVTIDEETMLPEDNSNNQELMAAIALNDLMLQANVMPAWIEFDSVMNMLIGLPDSLSPIELNSLLIAEGLNSIDVIESGSQLASLTNTIASTDLGVQQISSSDDSMRTQDNTALLPRAYGLFGQRFILDGWATTKTTYGSIKWDGEDIRRLIPSSLDVSFSTLGNDSAVPELVSLMDTDDPMIFRDNLNYQHNLAAIKETIDLQSEESWTSNLLSEWLYTLRGLSNPTTGDNYPEVFRTEAWAIKNIETQLASVAQLRHDSVLYAKQPVVPNAACFYPEGYVEPAIEFWQRLTAMASSAAAKLEQVATSDQTDTALKDLLHNQSAFFENFAMVTGKLATIVEKQSVSEEMTLDDKWYLENVVEIQIGYLGVTYNGWYPGLFYEARRDSDKWDALITDVQTTLPRDDFGYAGHVYHQGVGNINLMVIAIENEEDHVVYLGPTFSHYEFFSPINERLTDEQWQLELKDREQPEAPARTDSYLVPGEPEQINYEGGLYPDPTDICNFFHDFC